MALPGGWQLEVKIEQDFFPPMSVSIKIDTFKTQKTYYLYIQVASE